MVGGWGPLLFQASATRGKDTLCCCCRVKILGLRLPSIQLLCKAEAPHSRKGKTRQLEATAHSSKKCSVTDLGASCGGKSTPLSLLSNSRARARDTARKEALKQIFLSLFLRNSLHMQQSVRFGPKGNLKTKKLVNMKGNWEEIQIPAKLQTSYYTGQNKETEGIRQLG